MPEDDDTGVLEHVLLEMAEGKGAQVSVELHLWMHGHGLDLMEFDRNVRYGAYGKEARDLWRNGTSVALWGY